MAIGIIIGALIIVIIAGIWFTATVIDERDALREQVKRLGGGS